MELAEQAFADAEKSSNVKMLLVPKLQLVVLATMFSSRGDCTFHLTGTCKIPLRYFITDMRLKVQRHKIQRDKAGTKNKRRHNLDTMQDI